MPIKVYMTNMSSNQSVISNQRKLKHVLDTNKIDYITIDISDPDNKNEKEFLKQSLTVLNQNDSGWWQGSNMHGRIGLFPYVS